MRVERHSSEAGTWELVTRPIPSALAGLVARSTGYLEETPGRRRFREPVSAILPVILSFGDAIRMEAAPDPRLRGEEFVSFAAGLHDGPVVLEAFGRQHLAQIDLTPLGAFRLFGGMPLDDLANQVVDVVEVLGGDGARLPDRLAEAPDWESRFEILDGVLLERFARSPRPVSEVEWAWSRIVDTGGRVTVGDLARELGWSRRHLTARFRRHVGVSPKRAARIARFERARGMLVPPVGRSLAHVAAVCGYADQAHFNREFREFAGVTPTEYVGNWLPGSGVAA